jgi:hypothetical protein
LAGWAGIPLELTMCCRAFVGAYAISGRFCWVMVFPFPSSFVLSCNVDQVQKQLNWIEVWSKCTTKTSGANQSPCADAPNSSCFFHMGILLRYLEVYERMYVKEVTKELMSLALVSDVRILNG